jgi:hypothetical protein
MKTLWKTKNHYYIYRFIFLGEGADEDGETIQASVSCPLYVSSWHGGDDRIIPINIKRAIREEWKSRYGRRYCFENC